MFQLTVMVLFILAYSEKGSSQSYYSPNHQDIYNPSAQMGNGYGAYGGQQSCGYEPRIPEAISGEYEDYQDASEEYKEARLELKEIKDRLRDAENALKRVSRESDFRRAAELIETRMNTRAACGDAPTGWPSRISWEEICTVKSDQFDKDLAGEDDQKCGHRTCGLGRQIRDSAATCECTYVSTRVCTLIAENVRVKCGIELDLVIELRRKKREAEALVAKLEDEKREKRGDLRRAERESKRDGSYYEGDMEAGTCLSCGEARGRRGNRVLDLVSTGINAGVDIYFGAKQYQLRNRMIDSYQDLGFVPHPAIAAPIVRGGYGYGFGQGGIYGGVYAGINGGFGCSAGLAGGGYPGGPLGMYGPQGMYNPYGWPPGGAWGYPPSVYPPQGGWPYSNPGYGFNFGAGVHFGFGGPGGPGGPYPGFPGGPYPGFPGGPYPGFPGGPYPGFPGGQYPGYPGGPYPGFPGGQYPGFPGGQYPGFPGGPYPGFPGGQYPGFPGGQYPGFPGGQYPGYPGGQVPGYNSRYLDNYKSAFSEYVDLNQSLYETYRRMQNLQYDLSGTGINGGGYNPYYPPNPYGTGHQSPYGSGYPPGFPAY